MLREFPSRSPAMTQTKDERFRGASKLGQSEYSEGFDRSSRGSKIWLDIRSMSIRRRRRRRLDAADYKIKKQYILEGELLIWNDEDERIKSFHKIRRYIKRSGRFIGITRDSSVDSNEYLMIMFYDILLLDDTICIRELYDRRRRLFESLIHCISDRTDIGNREIIDFSFFEAPELLKEVFTRTIIRRWEEFILKNCDNLYFSFKKIKSFIKLKKDYISGLGDTADFAVIRGYRDARNEQKFKIRKL
jgi:DNA ligase-4